ncbi:hypothetical protein B0H16DRAFT_761828 [Mycena metata]|uniref:WW domain-containing protein n=1 Tax=Mycena metata TaxID=1033252 RepID=A0AAD7NBU3_9AGAR|nr:hypothetical protein B0H16DRAFT_761828 [Mycena metata]
MADETEILDWDEEDDASRAPFVPTDADEDAVSLGATSDEELDAADPAPAPEALAPPPPSETPETAEITPSKRPSPAPRHGHSGSRSRGERDRERHRDDRERDRDRDGHRERRPHKIMQPITHALPPKPVTTLPALPHGTSHSSSIEATLMAPSSLKDAKDGKPKSTSTPGEGKPKSSVTPNGSTDRDNYKSNTEALPEDWEVRQSRQSTVTANNPNGSTAYFYNTRTNKSTWERPRADSDDRARPRSGDERERDRPHSTRGHHRDGDGPMQIRNSNSSGGHVDSASGANEDDGLSYRDRHYRPEGSGDLASGTPATSIPGNGNISDHNAHRAPPKSPSPPSRGGRGRGRGRADDSRPGNGRWSPPPNNPNSIRSTSASMSSYPEPLGDFNSSKRPPGWNERDRERKYRDSRDSPPNRDQAARIPQDRGDPERERDQRTLQGQGPYSAGRALDDEPRERRGYASRPDERERRDARERDREPRDHRERDPSRDERPRRETDAWPRERERDIPPHQLESRKYDSSYESRKQDGAYGRDAPRNSNSNNSNLTQSQSHPREREPPGHREASMQQRDPPRDRDPQPPTRRDSHRDRDPQPPRSSAHPILSAPSTLTLHPAPLLRLRHSYPFRFRAPWW